MRIKDILKDRGMSQAGLAKKLGWSPQRLNSRLKNDNPTLDAITQIAKALDVEIHELFETSEKYAHWYDNGEWLGIRRK